MARKKRRKIEQYSTVLTIFSVFVIVLSLFFFKARISSVNIEVEKLKKTINKQEKVNESLTMKVNELVSMENMQSVASTEGLEYNNNNIIVINK